MFPVEIFRDTLIKLLQILDGFSIRYHLTGGVTSIAYGEPRLTQDIDIVVDPITFAQHITEFEASVHERGFLVEHDSLHQASASGGMFQLLDRSEALKLDVYVRQMIPGELDRSVNLEVFQGYFLPIVSRVDAVVSKLIWASKGSYKSRRDLRKIYCGLSETEKEQVSRLATQLSLGPLLQELLNERDEVE